MSLSAQHIAHSLLGHAQPLQFASQPAAPVVPPVVAVDVEPALDQEVVPALAAPRAAVGQPGAPKRSRENFFYGEADG
jgi:hypothetical protein